MFSGGQHLRHKGFDVRVEGGAKAIRPWGVMVWLQVKLPTGEVIAWPEFFGPYDHSRTLAGDWPRE